MRSTTIKVPVELRDRLAEIARDQGTTLAGAIARTLDVNADAQFWSEVSATMGNAAGHLRAAAEQDGATLTDGLDPDEDWSDVW